MVKFPFQYFLKTFRAALLQPTSCHVRVLLSLPNARSTLPDAESAISDAESALPYAKSALSDSKSALPDGGNARTGIPGSRGVHLWSKIIKNKITGESV